MYASESLARRFSDSRFGKTALDLKDLVIEVLHFSVNVPALGKPTAR